MFFSFRKSFFLGALYRKRKLANFCHALMQNPNFRRNYLCIIFFYPIHFLKDFFPIEKMAANCAEMGKVGKLGVSFQQVALVKNSDIFSILL